LSGGQRQRVAMGRAIVRDPQAFLMDEPLSNLDANLRVQIRSEIADLQSRLAVTTLYVTHDQIEAMTLGQRVAVLHAGSLQQVATPATLYQSPANTFVAQFIGSPGMNLFNASLIDDVAGRYMEISGQRLPIAAQSTDLDRYLNQPIQLGIRPEHIGLATTNDTATILAQIAAVETLGHETLVYCSLSTPAAQQSIVARLPAIHTYKVGETISLAFAVDKLHYFDAEGVAITPVLES
jgi:multiple sugar transport system ATP-binding protein